MADGCFHTVLFRWRPWLLIAYNSGSIVNKEMGREMGLLRRLRCRKAVLRKVVIRKAGMDTVVFDDSVAE